MSSTTSSTEALPGDPVELETLAATCRRAAAGLREDAAGLRRTEIPGWTGPAARVFAGSIARLPPELSAAAASYESVAAALLRYADDLRDAQVRAGSAAERLGDLGIRLLVEDSWLVGDVGPGGAALREQRVAASREEQQAARLQLVTAREFAAAAAGTAACRVRAACDAPSAAPDVLDRLAGQVGHWVEDRAAVLTDVSLVLKTVSAVAGVLAFVPVLAPVCIPLAVTAAVAALVIDGALASRGRGSWTGVGVDAALMAPGARPAGAAVREVRTRVGSVVVYRVEGTPNARVVIDADNNVTFRRRPMLYLNVGDRPRAEDFYRRKAADGLPGVQLKAFRVRKQAYRELSLRAVDQELAKAFHGRPHRVDATVARNQFGLWKSDFTDLERHILPGSGRVLR